MTNEQLEKLISDLMEDALSIAMFESKTKVESIEIAFKAAALPLMKKIEELEKKLTDAGKDSILTYDRKEKLQKENEELREALDWATRLLENLDDYEDNAQFYRAKFNLNKEN